MAKTLDNANPTIINVSELPSRRRQNKDADEAHSGRPREWDAEFECCWDQGYESSDQEPEPIDEQEIYDLISTISDPEHPMSLGQLAVVNYPDIHIDPAPVPGVGPDINVLTTVTVDLTPTVNHCSLATIIGLAVRVRLEKALPPNYRLDVRMKDGSHAQDDQVNKQLADKERVAAAMENDSLKKTLDTMLEAAYASDRQGW